MYNFYLSVAARKIVCADPSLRYTRMLLGRYATNQQTISGMSEGDRSVSGHGQLRGVLSAVLYTYTCVQD